MHQPVYIRDSRVACVYLRAMEPTTVVLSAVLYEYTKCFLNFLLVLPTDNQHNYALANAGLQVDNTAAELGQVTFQPILSQSVQLQESITAVPASSCAIRPHLLCASCRLLPLVMYHVSPLTSLGQMASCGKLVASTFAGNINVKPILLLPVAITESKVVRLTVLPMSFSRDRRQVPGQPFTKNMISHASELLDRTIANYRVSHASILQQLAYRSQMSLRQLLIALQTPSSQSKPSRSLAEESSHVHNVVYVRPAYRRRCRP